eukprot:COSAG02_NODE_28774_length_582_cov_3.039337_1_plen_48_part_10
MPRAHCMLSFCKEYFQQGEGTAWQPSLSSPLAHAWETLAQQKGDDVRE